jgi:cytochrome c oxidase subunit 4
MANDYSSSSRLPGPGERIRRLAENPVPSGGLAGEMAFAGGPASAAHAGGGHGGHDDAHGQHPTATTYVSVGIILTIITAVEVSAYYIPAWEQSAIYVPSMLFLSAVKFITVVAVYMHLKYDHKLFRFLFTGPFVIAFTTLFALMFLFGKLAIRLGILS